MAFQLPKGAEILTDPSQIKDYNILGQQGATGAPGSFLYGTKKVAPTVTADSSTNASDLGTTKNLNLPDQNKTDTATPFVSSLKDITDNFNKAYDESAKNLAPAQTEQNNLTTKLKGLLDSYGSKSEAYNTAQQTYQVPQQLQQLKDMNLAIAQKTGEYDKLSASLAGQGRGLTLGLVTGQQGAVAKQKAADIGAMTSVAAALQGNITLSEQLAQKSVDLQFQDKEDQINHVKTLLDLNKDSMSAAEKKQAAQLQYTLTQQQAQIDQAKEDRKQVLSIAGEAAKQGADNATITKITNAKNPEEALQFAGNSLGAKFRQDQEAAVLDNKYKLAQIANIKSEIANRGSSAASLDPATILAFSQQYASDGKIPANIPKGSFGLISQIAKELPKMPGTIVDTNTGIKSDKISGTQLDAYGALKDLNNKIAQAKNLFSTLNTGLIGGTFGNIFPTQERQEYDVLKGEIVDLLARARTGAAISANEEALYKSKLPGTFNKTLFIGTNGENKLNGLQKSLADKLDTQLKSNGVVMYGFSKVKVGDSDYTVGDIIQNESGQKGRVNPDGSITLVQ